MNPPIKLTKIAEGIDTEGVWRNLIDVYEGDNGMTYVVSAYEDATDPEEDEVWIAIAYPEYPFYAEGDVYTHLGSTDKEEALGMAGLVVAD